MKNNYKVVEDSIMVSGGVFVPRSQLADYHAREKAAAEERRRAENSAVPLPLCPFRDAARCGGEKCALYLDGCVFQKTAKGNAAPTIGKTCPMGSYQLTCRNNCALYRDGCVLTAIKESEA